MWRCDPPTRLVSAIVAGLVAAACGHPLVSLLAAVPWRPRALLVALALAAALWGGMRVAALQHRALAPGAIEGVVVVTGAPSGDRAVARVVAGREDVLLQAPGYRPQLGGIYRVTGRLREIDQPVRDYYASQGVHLELRGSRLVWLADRGGGWGVIDGLHRDALRRLGADGDPPADRALVAGVTLGETGALPADVRADFRTSGLYHLVSVAKSGTRAAPRQRLISLERFAVGLAEPSRNPVVGSPPKRTRPGAESTVPAVTGAHSD
jgi:predicted membrane metal-binding protein